MTTKTKPACAVGEITKGKVTCERPRYAFGVCQGHYKQLHEKRPYTQLRERNGAGELVTVTTRVRLPFHDQLLLAAAEHAISPYEMHQQILESWAERRIKAGAYSPRAAAAPGGSTKREDG